MNDIATTGPALGSDQDEDRVTKEPDVDESDEGPGYLAILEEDEDPQGIPPAI